MALGLGGQAFRFQPQANSVSPRDIVNRGLAAEEELYGGEAPVTPELPEDMAQVAGVNDDLMQNWAQLKGFADTMWKNYRINVTAPDYRNPIALQAHQTYLKALAGLRYAGQRLKDYNQRLAYTDKAVAEGAGEYVIDPRTGLYENPHEYFASTRQYAPATQSNQYQATDKITIGAYKAAQAGVNRMRGDVLEQQKAAEAANLPGLARTREHQAAQFVDSRYEQPYQLDEQYLARKKGQAEAINVYDEIANIRVGLANQDTNAISRLKGIPGIIDVRPVRTGYKTGSYITYRDGQDYKTEFISFKGGDSQYGGMAQLNDILQKLNPAKYKTPTNQLIPYFEQGIKNDVIGVEDDNMSPYFDKLVAVAKNLFTTKDTKLDGGVLIPVKAKQDFVNDLAELAAQGILRTPNGEQIYSVSWEDGKLLIDSETRPEGDPLVLDPKNKFAEKYIERLIEYNSSYLLPSELPNRTPYTEPQKIGEMSSRGGLKVDPFESRNISGGTNLDAKSIVDMFEQRKKK